MIWAKKQPRTLDPITSEQMDTFLHHVSTLNDPPDKLARDLKLCGYTGVRNSPNGCPLAQLLTDLAGRAVLVGHRTATLVGPVGGSQTVILPKGAQRFVQEFDAYVYPDLCETRAIR